MLGNLSCNVRLGYPTINVMPNNILPKAAKDPRWVQFGAWLRRMRKMSDLTQKAVADAAGIHEVQLARIEKGESGTKRETVIAIARAIGLDEETALNQSGYASIDPTAGGLIVPPVTRRPKNVAEFMAILGTLGDFEFSADLSNFTEDDFQELLERIAADVEITARRKNK